MTHQMLQELDGTNKYLQGVRVPNAVLGHGQQPGQPGYTLKQLRQDEHQLNYQRDVQSRPAQPMQQSALAQLYQASTPSAPANQATPSGVLAAFAPGFVQQQRASALPPPLPSSDTANSQVKASNYDAVDEMYQSIDDFEEKLARMRV